MIFALKQAIVLLQLSERDFPSMSCGPGTSSSVTSTSETGPQAQALSLLLFQVQFNADTLEASLFHLHIGFNGTAAPPGSPILDDRQIKKGSVNELPMM